MRGTSFATLALAGLLSGSLIAQGEWTEYNSDQDHFTCDFPGQPKVTEQTYTTQFGTKLPSRLYSVDIAPNNYYHLTVVDFTNIVALATEKAKSCPAGAEKCLGGNGGPGQSTVPGYSKADRAGAMMYATWQFMQRDAKVTNLLWTNMNLVEGNMIRLRNNKDGSQTNATIFMWHDKLYIVEGTVPKGYPEPGLFYQSVAWIDDQGNNIRYQDFYHNGSPEPPIMNRGGGAGPAGAQPQGAGGRGRGRQ